MSIPIFEEMRIRLRPVWEKEDHRRKIVWAGIFGSVGRGRAHKDSDVDVVMVMTEGYEGEPVELEQDLKDACGRDVSYIPIWRSPGLGSWMWGHVRVEALLSARTVYGDRKDVEHLRKEGLQTLLEARDRYDSIVDVVGIVKSCVSRAQTVETFISPDCQATQQECLKALRMLLHLLDIPDRNHPARTMVIFIAFEEAKEMQKILDTHPPNSLDLDASTWREIWRRFFVMHRAMWAWDIDCSRSREYIAHMLASARLAEHFEEGKVIDDSLYADIVR